MKAKIGIALALMLCLMVFSVSASPIVESMSLRGSDGSKLTGEYNTLNAYVVVKEDSFQSQGYAMSVSGRERIVMSWNTREYNEVVRNDNSKLIFKSSGYIQEGRTRIITPVTVTIDKKLGKVTTKALGTSIIVNVE
jgi:hypothetical protein